MSQGTDMRWLRWLLGGIVALLAVIAIELSVLIGPVLPQAMAQLPDSAAQRKELLEAQLKTQRSIDAVLQHLRTSVVKVKVVGTDKDSEAAPKQTPAASTQK